jgi:hypothetical protein
LDFSRVNTRMFQLNLNSQVPTDFVLQIVRQNPSLESIAVFSSELEDPLDFKKELKEVNRRVEKFVDLVRICVMMYNNLSNQRG